jgi:hypothetical protein
VKVATGDDAMAVGDFRRVANGAVKVAADGDAMAIERERGIAGTRHRGGMRAGAKSTFGLSLLGSTRHQADDQPKRVRVMSL